MKSTFQPNNRKKAKKHGFFSRKETNILKNRRKKGRKVLSKQPLFVVVFFFLGSDFLKKYEIVKKNDEFNDIINTGKYLKNRFYNIYYKDGNTDFPKFGIAVSKKIGHAVERNKIKRQLRSLIDQHKNLFAKPNNYIIMVRKGVKELSYSEMEEQFVHLLQKGFLNEKN